MQQPLLMSVAGFRYAIDVYSSHLIIRASGYRNNMIPLDAITAINFKPYFLFTRGHIAFGISGASSIKVEFSKRQAPAMQALRDYVQTLMLWVRQRGPGNDTPPPVPQYAPMPSPRRQQAGRQIPQPGFAQQPVHVQAPQQQAAQTAHPTRHPPAQQTQAHTRQADRHTQPEHHYQTEPSHHYRNPSATEPPQGAAQARTTTPPDPGTARSLWTKDWFIILMLFILAPAGFAMLWRPLPPDSTFAERNLRIVVTVVFVFVFLFQLGVGFQILALIVRSILAT